LVDLYVCVSARLRFLLCHPNEKLPAFSEEVGFGRRERGDANELYILGGILPLTAHMSMILILPICMKKIPWMITHFRHHRNFILLPER
jgi:hypothetical protein